MRRLNQDNYSRFVHICHFYIIQVTVPLHGYIERNGKETLNMTVKRRHNMFETSPFAIGVSSTSIKKLISVF